MLPVSNRVRGRGLPFSKEQEVKQSRGAKERALVTARRQDTKVR